MQFHSTVAEIFNDSSIRLFYERMTVPLEYLSCVFLYVVASCFITHWCFILFFSTFKKDSLLFVIHLRINFQLIPPCGFLIEIETLGYLMRKNIVRFLPRVGLALVTTKRHLSDINPQPPVSGLSCRLISKLTFAQIINYYFKDLVWIALKLVLTISFGYPTNVPNFSQNELYICKFKQFFSFV